MNFSARPLSGHDVPLPLRSIHIQAVQIATRSIRCPTARLPRRSVNGAAVSLPSRSVQVFATHLFPRSMYGPASHLVHSLREDPAVIATSFRERRLCAHRGLFRVRPRRSLFPDSVNGPVEHFRFRSVHGPAVSFPSLSLIHI